MNKLLIFVNLVICSLTAQSASFCITNSNELINALAIAGSNGENNEIKIHMGDYLTLNSTPFNYFAQSNHSLHISGGWTNFNQFNCLNQPGKPFDTALDGNDLSTVLSLSTAANSLNIDITIENLTIANGFSDSVLEAGAGVHLQPDHQGVIMLNRLMFLGNKNNTNGAGASLAVYNSELTTVSNSVFMFNHTADGNNTVLITSPLNSIGVYFINNTMIGNTSDVTVPGSFSSSGLVISLAEDNNGGPEALIANNLFWNNDQADFVTTTSGVFYLYNNNFENRAGSVDFEANNISLNPMLAAALLDFTPQPGSPLIDQGLSEPLMPPNPTSFLQGWSYGSQDFDGFLGRVQNTRVDIGAVEAPPEIPIFENGFDN